MSCLGIREIRLNERRLYQKITDLYALSADYDRNDETTIDYSPGATPLDCDEAEGLLFPHITNRQEPISSPARASSSQAMVSIRRT